MNDLDKIAAKVKAKREERYNESIKAVVLNSEEFQEKTYGLMGAHLQDENPHNQYPLKIELERAIEDLNTLLATYATANSEDSDKKYENIDKRIKDLKIDLLSTIAESQEDNDIEIGILKNRPDYANDIKAIKKKLKFLDENDREYIDNKINELIDEINKELERIVALIPKQVVLKEGTNISIKKVETKDIINYTINSKVIGGGGGSVGGANAFTELVDVPSSYAGKAGKVATVNGAENALVFEDVSSGASAFIDLTDAPNSYVGQAGKVPQVNGTENGLQFLDIAATYLKIDASNAIANTTINALLPSQTSNSGKYLTTNGTNTSWGTITPTAPGGSTTQLQYNNSGAFGGIAGLTYNGTTLAATIPQTITLATASNIGLTLKTTDDSPTNPMVAFKDSGGTNRLVIKTVIDGSIVSVDNFIRLDVVEPAGFTQAIDAVVFQVTSPSNSTTNKLNGAVRINHLAGYTGPANTTSLAVTNGVSGTNTSLGNMGLNASAIGATAGQNIAGRYAVSGSTLRNLGIYALAGTNTAGDNIGTFSVALNASGVQVGVFAGLFNSVFSLTSAALIADNGATSSPIFLARDNTTTVFQIADGGIVTIGIAETPVITTANTQVYGAGSSYGIWRDTTNDTEILIGAESGDVVIGSMTNHKMSIRTNNAERLSIANTGAVTVTNGTASEKKLIVKATASQSVNNFEVQNSSSTVLYGIAAGGQVKASPTYTTTTAADNDRAYQIFATVTNGGSNPNYPAGIWAEVDLTGTTAWDSSAQIFGLIGLAANKTSGTTLVTGTAELIGMLGSAEHNGSVGGTTGNTYGLVGRIQLTSTGTPTLTNSAALQGIYNVSQNTTVTTAKNVDAKLVIAGGRTLTSTDYYYYGVTKSISGTFSPTNLYGLYLPAITEGGTLNYAIYTNAGLTHFGDSVDLASGKNLTMLAGNIVTDTTTGTKIGTGTTQKLGFWNATPIVRPAAYTPTNVSADRSYDANSTTTDELADILGTLITDLQSIGLIG